MFRLLGKTRNVSYDVDTRRKLLVYRNSFERFLRRTGIVKYISKFIFLDEEKKEKIKTKKWSKTKRTQRRPNDRPNLGAKKIARARAAISVDSPMVEDFDFLDVVHFVRIRTDHFCVRDLIFHHIYIYICVREPKVFVNRYLRFFLILSNFRTDVSKCISLFEFILFYSSLNLNSEEFFIGRFFFF